MPEHPAWASPRLASPIRLTRTMDALTKPLLPARSLTVLAAVLGGIVLAVLLHLSSRSLRNKHLPPGPPTSFLKGTRDLPSLHSWLKCHEWAQQYGEVFTIWNNAITPVVVIGGYAAAQAILEKQSNVTSSRPFVRWMCSC